MRLNLLDSLVVTGKARPPPPVSSPLVTEAPLHRPGITVLQSVNTVHCLQRSALRSPAQEMHFPRNTALFIYRVFVCKVSWRLQELDNIGIPDACETRLVASGGLNGH